jgi:hypothetical protein
MTYRERKELEQQIKKEQIKEWILFTFILIFISILLFHVLNCQYVKAVEKCSTKHEKSYCEVKLR